VLLPYDGALLAFRCNARLFMSQWVQARRKVIHGR
jgi:hypothetical protein